jgi:hypothetical protein
MTLPKFPPLQTQDFGWFKQSRLSVKGRRDVSQLIPGFYHIFDAVGDTKEIIVTAPFVNGVSGLAYDISNPKGLYHYDIDTDVLKEIGGVGGFNFDVILEQNGDNVKNGGNINPDQVLFVILTDGAENASKEWDLGSLSELIKEKQDQKERPWQFTFVGANIDEWATAKSLGGAKLARSSLAYNATSDGMAFMSANLCSATRMYRNSGEATVDSFFDQDASGEDFEGN